MAPLALVVAQRFMVETFLALARVLLVELQLHAQLLFRKIQLVQPQALRWEIRSLIRPLDQALFWQFRAILLRLSLRVLIRQRSS